MQTFAFLSEKGGVRKTAVATGLAGAAARAGYRVTVIDLDPRATATRELDPKAFALTVNDLLAYEDPAGLAEQAVVGSKWHPNLSVLPSSRALGNRESDRSDHAEFRLRESLAGYASDLILVDTPPRPGGVLVLNALAAADRAVLVTTLDSSGLEGMAETSKTLRRARQYINDRLSLAGVVVAGGDLRTRDARRCLEELREAYGDRLLEPLLPERVIMREARAACAYVDDFGPEGREMAAHFAALLGALVGRN